MKTLKYGKPFYFIPYLSALITMFMQEITVSKNPLRENGTFEEIGVSKGNKKSYKIAVGMYLKCKK